MGYGLFKIKNGIIEHVIHDFLWVCHCKYRSILYHFWDSWRWKISWPWNL